MCKIILVRPGRTDFDDQNRIQGSLDLPLNESGIREVAEIVELLRESEIDLILTSSVDPARTTAETLGMELDIPVKECSGLENLKQGLWEGLEESEVQRMYCKAYRTWKDSPESVCPPEGETMESARSRICKTLKKPLKKKNCIAIIAAEPLASLIKSVVVGDGMISNEGLHEMNENSRLSNHVEILSPFVKKNDTIVSS